MAIATYHMSGEFGGFHPTAPDSPREKSSRVVTTERSKPAAQPSADMHVSTDVENETLIEMPLEPVVQECIAAQPEAWKQAHLVCRSDEKHGYVLGFTAPALDTWVPDVAP
jgi:hypothetical protein